MPVSAATSYDLKVFGARNVGGLFFSSEPAKKKALEIIRDTEAEVVEVWRNTHKHWCGVTEVACTCGGVDSSLEESFTSRDLHRAPPRGEPLFAAGAPARGRLSGLAERAAA